MILSYINYGQDNVAHGHAAFGKGNYSAAIKYYSTYDKLALDKDVLEKRGLSYYYINDLELAIRDFTKAKRLGNTNPEMYFRMAKIKQALGELEEAVFFYKSFIKLIDKDHQSYERAKIELKNCVYLAFNKTNEQVATIQSFGEQVNTSYDEIYPLRSPKYGNIYYFSTNRNQKDFEIQSFSLNKKGDWSETDDLIADINTAKHDFIQDVSADGQSLLFIKQGAELQDRQLVFSTFLDNEKVEIIIPDSLSIMLEDIQIVNHHTLAFASNKLSGFGGYDLFTIEYMDSIWSKPKNLGSTINSVNDDRFPYFVNQMNQLFFSSNRPYSYGGFDIYSINLSNEEKVNNIGRPINTSGDEINFRLDLDGHTAIYSSNSKEGIGGFDLYFAYMKNLSKIDPRDSIQFQYLYDQINIIKEKKASELTKQSLKLDDLIAIDNLNNELEETTSIIPDIHENLDTSSVIEGQLSDTEEALGIDTISTSKNKILSITSDYEISRLEAINSYVLFYQDRKDLINEKNKEIIHSLAYYLFNNDDLYVRLLGHTDITEPGLPEFVQYNTFLRAKTIAEHLIKLGIDDSRIQIESLASNYPIAKKEVAGNSNSKYDYLNKRIEVQIVDVKGNIIQDHKVDTAVVPLTHLDRKHILFQDIREELYFSVQVSSVPRIFKNAILRLYDDIYVRREYGSTSNDYYIGIYTKYADAKVLYESLSHSSAPISKIVAFYNGKKLNKEEVKILSKDYQDLRNLN